MPFAAGSYARLITVRCHNVDIYPVILNCRFVDIYKAGDLPKMKSIHPLVPSCTSQRAAGFISAGTFHFFDPTVKGAMPIKILVADPHDVVRQGVRAILSCRPDYQVCGEASNGQEAVAAARELRPHVVILDLAMPVMNGLAAAEEIVEFGFDTKILILTMYDPTLMLPGVQSVGAHGIVSKCSAKKDLIPALEALLNGETFWPDTESPRRLVEPQFY